MDALLDAASWACLMVGSVFCVIGGVGTLRLPDVYARTHAASITDTLGAGLVLLGLTFQAGPTQVALKLVMIYLFMLYTGPAASHALVKAAYAQGLKADAERIATPSESPASPASGESAGDENESSASGESTGDENESSASGDTDSDPEEER